MGPGDWGDLVEDPVEVAMEQGATAGMEGQGARTSVRNPEGNPGAPEQISQAGREEEPGPRSIQVQEGLEGSDSDQRQAGGELLVAGGEV